MRMLILAALVSALAARPATAIGLDELDVDLGMQHRVMYNNSDIGSENQYDFFRQRLRLSLDVKTADDVGGFLQLEYRGGFGGSSPAFSDPRNAYDVNAFNRLEARGLRYGYLYFPLGNGTVSAGLVPLNDQVGQTLFSADWDLNVGGVTYEGKQGGADYRLAYLRLVDGVFYRDDDRFEDEDQHLVIADLSTRVGEANAGLHFYGTYGEISEEGVSSGVEDEALAGVEFSDLRQSWIGPHVTFALDRATVGVVALYDTGEIATGDTEGWLVKLEASAAVGASEVSVLGLYSSGDDEGEGFQTIHGLFGTGGYWGYTYLFTPHGPSDVNDFGLEPGNRGFGLSTVQARVNIPLGDTISAQVAGGWFASSEDMGEDGKDLGAEVGAQLAFDVGKYMQLEIGAAVARLGDAGEAVYQGADSDTVNEVFSRLQLEF